MNAAIEAFRQKLTEKSKDEIIEEAVEVYRQLIVTGNKLTEMQNTDHEMILQFQQMQQELAGAKKENATLLKQNRHLTELNALRSRDLFGRGTERSADVLAASIEKEENSDPLDEYSKLANADEKEPACTRTPKCKYAKKTEKEHQEQKKKKTPGKRDRDLEGLPTREIFDFDIEELNRAHGEGNWRFAFWEPHRSVETTKPLTYQQIIYTPVVSVGLEHDLHRIPYEAMIPKSLASPSLLARILTDKYHLFLPLYRQEHDKGRFGFPLSRQTMSNWVIRVSRDYFRPVYEHLIRQLRVCPYQQCDETTYLVIRDGRNPGAKSFVWTHRTSELLDTPAIIAYCYEKTRGTDHLRNFYAGVTNKIYLTSDAYGAYSCFAEENEGQIILCGCFMHARRRYVEALAVLDTKGIPKEDLQKLPEARAIQLIAEIYQADEALKGLSAGKRQKRRDLEVRPKVEAFYEFLDSIDLDDPLISEKLKDAVQYSLNEKEKLLRFLEDGNIPIDDGATERNIRPIALIRRNSLFSFSIDGAESMAISSTLIATAKANGADTFYYLKYLLEQMPGHLNVKDDTYLSDLMPWSDAYKRYEKDQKQQEMNRTAPAGNEKPKTPGKKKHQVAV